MREVRRPGITRPNLAKPANAEKIVGLDGSPLRRLILDPTKDYQRIR